MNLLPSDILIEISGYLQFVDCIHLSQANNYLYKILHNNHNNCYCLNNYLKSPDWTIFFNIDSENQNYHNHSIIWNKYKELPHKFRFIDFMDKKGAYKKNQIEAENIIKTISTQPIKSNSYLEATMKSINKNSREKYNFRETIDVISNGIKIGYVIRRLEENIYCDNYDKGFFVKSLGYIYTNLMVNFDEINSKQILSNILKKSQYSDHTKNYYIYILDYIDGNLININNGFGYDSVCGYTTKMVVEKIKYIYELLRNELNNYQNLN